MYDVMLEEAKMWLDEPPLRERKLGFWCDRKDMSDVMLEEAKMWLDEPPLRERTLESPVYSPPVPVEKDSDDEMDPVEEAKYLRQVRESDSPYLPLEMKKVVVQTREDVESSMKLRSSNVILYMRFKTRGGIECKGIIRQTRDGKPGHMCLEINCWMDK